MSTVKGLSIGLVVTVALMNSDAPSLKPES